MGKRKTDMGFHHPYNLNKMRKDYVGSKVYELAEHEKDLHIILKNKEGKCFGLRVPINTMTPMIYIEKTKKKR